MKKLLYLIFAASLFSIIPGCGFTKDSSSSDGLPKSNVKYQIVNESSIPKSINYKINIFKSKRGYYVFKDDNCILISSGKKNTGGYKININSVENTNGNFKIVVEEITPSPNAIVTQVITYPHILIKVTGPIKTVIVVNTNNIEFNPIESSSFGVME